MDKIYCNLSSKLVFDLRIFSIFRLVARPTYQTERYFCQLKPHCRHVFITKHRWHLIHTMTFLHC